MAVSLSEAVRTVLGESAQPLSPGQIRDKIKAAFPHLYQTDAHRVGIEAPVGFRPDRDPRDSPLLPQTRKPLVRAFKEQRHECLVEFKTRFGHGAGRVSCEA